MKPGDVKSGTYTEFKKENNKKDSKSEVGDHVRTWKYNYIFAKVYSPNQSEVFLIKKVKNTVLWTYGLSDFNGEEIVKTFSEKIAKNKSKKFQVETVIKKWESYNNSF